MGKPVFLIYGAGAMGSLFGSLLSQKYTTYIIGRKDHVDEINRRGLLIEGITQGSFSPGSYVNLDELLCDHPDFRVDFCMLFSKSHGTQEILETMKKYPSVIDSSLTFVSLQNGLDNEEKILREFSDNPIIGGYTCHGAIFDRPGHVEHTGIGDTVMGPYSNTDMTKVEELARCLDEVGIVPTLKEDIRDWIYKKVIINASINPLTALLNIRNGMLLENEGLQRIIHEIIYEGCRVAELNKISISSEIAFEMVRKVILNTRGNISSMLQDIRNGKPTEIDSINGAIVKLAENGGLKAPVNSSVHNLIKVLEQKSPSMGN